jgi:hypothetical protein
MDPISLIADYNLRVPVNGSTRGSVGTLPAESVTAARLSLPERFVSQTAPEEGRSPVPAEFRSTSAPRFQDVRLFGGPLRAHLTKQSKVPTARASS